MSSLIKLSEINTALAKVKTIDEAKGLRDKARAIEVYTKQVNESFETQNHAAEIKVRAERRIGELLPGAVKHGGDRKSTFQPESLILSDLGVSVAQSSRWQSIARIPSKDFEGHIASAKDGGKEITTAGLLKLSRKFPKNSPPEEPETEVNNQSRFVYSLDDVEGETFGCIYADPPWKYGNQATRASTDNHYGTMTIEELCAMPVASLAAEEAHLHLWTTNGFLFEAKQVMEAWGFTYKSCFVWVKTQMGIGNYWRVSHEFLLLGVKGALSFADHSLMSWAEIARSEHSAKPDAVRLMVEKASPGPRLEMFGRSRAEGWTVFGNELDPQKRMFA